jgi:hypothetical protein
MTDSGYKSDYDASTALHLAALERMKAGNGHDEPFERVLEAPPGQPGDGKSSGAGGVDIGVGEHSVSVVAEPPVVLDASIVVAGKRAPVRMIKWLQSEPVAIMGVIQTGLALAIGFGLHLTDQQMGLSLAFSSAVLALLTRQTVTSTLGS